MTAIVHVSSSRTSVRVVTSPSPRVLIALLANHESSNLGSVANVQALYICTYLHTYERTSAHFSSACLMADGIHLSAPLHPFNDCKTMMILQKCRFLVTEIRSQAVSTKGRRAAYRRCIGRSFATTNATKSGAMKLWEFPAASSGSEQRRKRGVLYTESSHGWETQMQQQEVSSSSSASPIQNVSQDVLAYFLPAQYPKSVAPGYARFAGFCFTASVAGSAAMVLSTQTLLLAVGVVGSNVQQAGIMAGAFNWVMKDFVGQLGGVLFASQMGKTRAFDADPKRWRMVAAMALDGATLLEILSPLFPSILVLPVASIANVGKNIGFLTASASRAALHQSLAITGNLGDVTAKAGSQSIVASLVGTSLGIGLSSILSHDTYNFALGFCVLGIVHQGCNYLALQSVSLTYFNRQRLHILLEQFIRDDTVMSPTQVAAVEPFYPLLSGDASTNKWLSVGNTPLHKMFPNPLDLRDSIARSDTPYLISNDPSSGHVHLIFFDSTTGEDMIQGMYHACLLHDCRQVAASQVESGFQRLIEGIHRQGWKTEAAVTTIEHSDAKRIEWQ